MSCHDIYSQENISRIACARMDRHIQVIIFAAFGLLLNFVFQSQQNNAGFLVLLMHYQQAFQRLVSAVRRRRVRLNPRPAHRAHLSSLGLLGFAHSCRAGHLNHPNQLGSQHCCCVICSVDFNFHWSLLQTRFVI